VLRPIERKSKTSLEEEVELSSSQIVLLTGSTGTIIDEPWGHYEVRPSNSSPEARPVAKTSQC